MVCPNNDEEESANTTPGITIVLDPIQTVARKSVHHHPSEMEDKDDEDDSKPAATTTPMNFANNDPKKNAECDRLSSLTEDLLYRITSFLDAPDLLSRLGLVNHYYHDVTTNNEAGWVYLCERHWRDKCHISPAALAMANTTTATTATNTKNKCAAYRIAGTVWSFRFKESAGSDWTSVDPWYQGQPCRKMVFLPDGTMKQLQQQPPVAYTGMDDEGDDAENARLPHVVVTATGQQQQQQQPVVELVEPPLRMTWRFLTRPMDLPTRPTGSYVRIQVGGRDVPTYAVRRSPTGNWGFVLESCWGVYASFELPPRRLPQPPDRDHPAAVLRRGPNGTAVWVRTNSDESARSSPLQQQQQRRPTTAADMQDDSMLLTNEVQWREAFLYNVGARVLPEGVEATDEFDRFWQGL
jgi:hypothetical protein